MTDLCWKTRPCDLEMQSRCPHADPDDGDRCPMKCAFATCQNPQHKLIEDFALYANGLTLEDEAIKDECMYCEFFLKACARHAKTQPGLAGS